jgi:hypothetical protein
MVNAVFTSFPTFYLCKLKIPSSVVKQIDKYRRHCLWRGADINATRPAQAAWHLPCRPKQKGGMGILDLKKHSEALQMKMLHKFLKKQEIPWVHLIWGSRYNNGSFWWRDILNNLSAFLEISNIKHYRKHLNFRRPKTHENKRKPTKIHYFSSTKLGNYLRRYRQKLFIFVGFPKADENSWSDDYFRRPQWPTKIGA